MICQKLVLYPFYLIRQLFELYHICLEVHCIRYELHLFMAKAFNLLKLIWPAKAEEPFLKSLVWPVLEPETSPSRFGCASTKPNLLWLVAQNHLNFLAPPYPSPSYTLPPPQYVQCSFLQPNIIIPYIWYFLVVIFSWSVTNFPKLLLSVNY